MYASLTCDGDLAVDHPLLDRLLCLRAAPRAAQTSDTADTPPPMRFGVEDPDGRIAQVIETASLVEAVAIFELLREFGLQPTRGRRVGERFFARIFRRPAAAAR